MHVDLYRLEAADLAEIWPRRRAGARRSRRGRVARTPDARIPGAIHIHIEDAAATRGAITELARELSGHTKDTSRDPSKFARDYSIR